jgi:hypothetical protein
MREVYMRSNAENGGGVPDSVPTTRVAQLIEDVMEWDDLAKVKDRILREEDARVRVAVLLAWDFAWQYPNETPHGWLEMADDILAVARLGWIEIPRGVN